MINKLRLQNFRGFRDHTVRFRPLTVLVGRNNAGKSTIVEALTLVALVANRFQHSTFKEAPAWTELPWYTRGVNPSLKGTDIKLEGHVFHKLNGPPAIITATFSTKDTITVYVGPDGAVFAVIHNEEGTIVSTKAEALRIRIPDVNVLPQVGPVDPDEEVKSTDYVLRSISTRRSPLHFRNQLRYMGEAFDLFTELAETSWKGLRIRNLDRVEEEDVDKLMLWVQDGDFVAEVGWMGHGLQMWLQVMWFLARTPAATTVILDEPDVYMHPDLQRRLVRLVEGRYSQTIIATHSVEILAEVDPDCVLVVDKTRARSTFASNIPAVQQVIDHIGGVHNLHLARLASAKRFLAVEGDDVSFLKEFQDVLSPRSAESIASIPRASIEGFANWKYVIGSAMAFKNASGELIKTYCILDSDYHLDEEIEEILKEAERHGVNLHIWSRKEIENYLLVPTAIERLITNRIKRGQGPIAEEIAQEIDRISRQMREVVEEGYAAAVQARGRKDVVQAMREAKRVVAERGWDTPTGRLAMVSGKDVLGALSAWTSANYRVSFGPEAVAKELQRGEIAPEVAMVVRAIESGADFSARSAFIARAGTAT